jgi:alanyl-tRNA synthetase
MKGSEVRNSFVNYFKKHAHTHVGSSRLIPENDDTLLFANAGMNQFKNIFLGLEKRDYNRAVTSQKCVRAGGKHNDLENVGHTARHHTFFEMLGNFSFGDYFKKEAIHFAWDWLTKDLGISKDKLHVTVFRDDDEAAEIWHKQEKVPLERISRFDEKDNFWMMGDTGPCGPCSEIFYDHGPEAGCKKPDCKVGCSCDRYVEIWNLVFMQFNQKEDGTRERLPKPSVDTGSGLERVTAAMQGVFNNYDTDLFVALIQEGLKGSRYESKIVWTSRGFKPSDDQAREVLTALRVVADHARATAFLIADGVLPSNEGRGYVLRRIMRRAIRYGRKLETETSVLQPVVKRVIATFSDFYPELKQQQNLIEVTAKGEEERFLQTLDQGTLILNEEIKKLKAKGTKQIAGETVFKLYDTFGFPVDLTNLIAREQGLTVDETKFEEIMEKARSVAKASWKGKAISADAAHLIELSQKASKTDFKGYETMVCEGKALKVSDGKSETLALKKGQRGILISDQTCFYAESGGQVGDKGEVRSQAGRALVFDCTKMNDVYLHHIEVLEGEIKPGAKIELVVGDSERRSTARNHSATHLLHAALKTVLGTHVTQAGSMVGPDRLRFDFTHSQSLSPEEIEEIENLVNREVSISHDVETKVMGQQEAMKSGAVALFGEKYGDKVRVVQMGAFSMELCGGTHVHNTSDIRVFKIVSEGGISAGVRRIEAVTGDVAVQFLFRNTKEALATRNALNLQEPWTRLAGLDSEQPLGLADAIEKTKSQIKTLEREVKTLKGGQINVDQIAQGSKEIPGGRLVYTTIDTEDRQVLSDVSDRIKDKIRSGVIIVIGKGADSHPIIVSVTKDLSSQYNAGKILQVIASEMGGKGGGRPDFAQGAGKDFSKVSQAQKKTETLLGLV